MKALKKPKLTLPEVIRHTVFFVSILLCLAATFMLITEYRTTQEFSFELLAMVGLNGLIATVTA